MHMQTLPYRQQSNTNDTARVEEKMCECEILAQIDKCRPRSQGILHILARKRLEYPKVVSP